MNPINVLVDLDGVLAECASRAHWAREKNWQEYHRRGCSASVLLDGQAVVGSLLAAGFRIHIITGRSEDWRPQTDRWFVNKHIKYHELTMRKVGDYRPSVEYKMDEFKKYHPDAVLMILEDDERVTAAARMAGYTVYHTRYGGHQQ